ncbi:hypothetical protein [Jannaschia sp. LMIT008]|uniref:hypothetical protein n=1 Tax=Jannaschia maritima TaxID=3032585 RepID=UPI002810E775|nr:hypothetical protein [Jannaschia sp. LMIT008]
MIRPDAAATLHRWREAGLGAFGVVLGLWLWATTFGLPALLGLALAVVGAVLLLSGLRRALFDTGARAPGVVTVDEGRITYMGPVMGGTVALDDLTEVAHRRSTSEDAFWRLSADGQAPVFVPAGALGADALPDALAPLPGFDAIAMVRVSRRTDRGTVIVWRRPGRAALT